MNHAHLHLLLNHFPIIGTILSFLTLLAGIILKQPGIKRAGLGLFVLTGIMTIPAFLTGEGAEEVLKSIGQNPEALEEKHENLGEIVVWICSITGLIALLSLLLEKRLPAIYKILTFSILIISLGNFALLKNVGTSGGEIRHTEIRSTSIGTGVQPDQNIPKNESEEGEEEDD